MGRALSIPMAQIFLSEGELMPNDILPKD